ncbi:MAG: sigma-70 family RNA polymerase sigma factor [Bacteroidetes bacterium]|nr:MAG: sigma-70 family RNA polymerase sigma factor [Bacteroidota bacterium]
MSGQTDSTYMEALCRGDSGLLRELYARFAPQVRSWVLRNNGSSDDAQDLLQEALMAVYDRYCVGEGTFSGSFGGLLFTICRRRWYDRLAEKKRAQDVRKEDLYGQEDEAPAVEAAEEALEAHRRMERLEAAFQQLSEQCQRLLRRFAEGAKDPDALAAELGIPSANAVYQAKHRCLKRWRALYQQTAQCTQP